MANNLTVTDSDARGELCWLSKTSYVRQATTSHILKGLAQSLALVAPVAMTEEDRAQWLAVAVRTIYEKHLSVVDFDYAVKAARDECDHPAKIVPAIIKALGEHWRPAIAQVEAEPVKVPVERRIEAPLVEIPLNEIAAMPEHMRQMGLSKGWITQAQIDALQAA